MNYRQKQYYSLTQPAPAKPEEPAVRVYFRNADGSLGRMDADPEVCTTLRKTILTVKEALVAEGEDMDKKAVLAIVEGGKE